VKKCQKTTGRMRGFFWLTLYMLIKQRSVVCQLYVLLLYQLLLAGLLLMYVLTDGAEGEMMSSAREWSAVCWCRTEASASELWDNRDCSQNTVQCNKQPCVSIKHSTRLSLSNCVNYLTIHHGSYLLSDVYSAVYYTVTKCLFIRYDLVLYQNS